MENLNAEQIKKALECCLANDICDSKCGECQYKSTGADCMDCMLRDALALINSQEQKIKELTEDLHATRTELTRVQEDNDRQKKFVHTAFETAKTFYRDGVKEMQERLKEKAFSVPTVYNSHFDRMIDQIAKEVLGE